LRVSRRGALWIGGVASVMFVARMAVIEAVWLKADRVYAADIAVIDTLPQGAMLAVAYPPRDINAGAIPELHVATLAAARREAFVPTVFTYATQQPLALRSPYDALAAATSPSMIWNGFVGHHTSAHDASAHVLKDYDFVVFVDRAPFTVPTDRRLETRAATPTFQLLAINHDCR
ncbi:MAG TPA: hypothetical protein VMI30_13680, partial [Stellaceae bacterium]|nr:hypothetical protein [Stellaceae bacterium]